jgi:hypothetical protein
MHVCVYMCICMYACTSINACMCECSCKYDAPNSDISESSTPRAQTSAQIHVCKKAMPHIHLLQGFNSSDLDPYLVYMCDYLHLHTHTNTHTHAFLPSGTAWQYVMSCTYNCVIIHGKHGTEYLLPLPSFICLPSCHILCRHSRKNPCNFFSSKTQVPAHQIQCRSVLTCIHTRLSRSYHQVYDVCIISHRFGIHQDLDG